MTYTRSHVRAAALPATGLALVILYAAALGVLLTGNAWARGGGGRGGGGGRMSRPSGGFSRPSGGMSRPSGGYSRPSGGYSRPGYPGGGPNAGRPGYPGNNVSVPRRNINTGDINYNHNVNVNGGWGGDWNNDWGGFAAGAAVGGLTGAAIAGSNNYGAPAAGYGSGYGYGAVAPGTVVYSMPPSCTPTVVGGVEYQYCGGTYYLPQYQGTSIVYQAVPPP